MRQSREVGRDSIQKNGRAKAARNQPRPGALEEVVWEALSILEELHCDEHPSPLRVRLRTLRGRLGIGYANEVDVAQELAELDGEGHEDGP